MNEVYIQQQAATSMIPNNSISFLVPGSITGTLAEEFE
jgi:hypothetical protein